MMEMDGQLNKAMGAHVEYERAWWQSSRRGRWVVLEPGPGRLLTKLAAADRDYVDAITPQRGRRFSSLSRARAFAREIGGEVHRWRRQLPRRVGERTYKAAWRYETNPWKAVADQSSLFLRAL